MLFGRAVDLGRPGDCSVKEGVGSNASLGNKEWLGLPVNPQASTCPEGRARRVISRCRQPPRFSGLGVGTAA